MIVITGASGQLGNAIIKKLLDLVPADQIIASTRDALAATDITELGVSVRQGDYDDYDSLVSAFAGASQVLLISSNAAAQGGDPIAHHRTAIRAAQDAGVKRIVYTSHMAANLFSAFPPMRDHGVTEGLLAESGLKWTALRNGFYGASGLAMIEDAFESGTFETTQDGKIAWAAHDDLAQAAANILADEGKFDGPTPALTGSQALDFGVLIEIASDLLGKPISRTIISDNQMTEKLSGFKVPSSVIDIILGLYKAAKNDEFSTVDPALEALIGRAPMTMQELIAAKLGTFGT